MYQKFSFVAIQIQMIKFLSHKHTSTSLASLYWKAGERANLQKGTKISVPLFLMIRLSSLNHFKMLQRILYRFHFLCCRMLPRLFQFFYRIRSIVHRQAQISFYLCDICGMYLEAVFSFYVLLYHFVGHSFFGLIFFGSFSDIIKRNFSLTLAKLNFYVDMSVWLFVGKQYYRLDMYRFHLRNAQNQSRSHQRNAHLHSSLFHSLLLGHSFFLHL